MRVLVAAAPMGKYRGAAAANQIARGWHRAGADQLAVLGFGAADGGWVDAYGDLHQQPVTEISADDVVIRRVQVGETVVYGPQIPSGQHHIDPEATSVPLGAAIRHGCASGARRIIVELNTDAHDGGAGLLAAVGGLADRCLTAGVTGLHGISQVDLNAANRALAGIELVGLVAEDEVSDQLLGLRGITARRGTRLGMDPEQMLRIDADLAAYAAAVDPALAKQDGAGASGGAGFAIGALGGRISTGSELLAVETELDTTIAGADLIVIGTQIFDFHHCGGPVLTQMASRARAAGIGCVVLADQVQISTREMRILGVDAAYQVDPETLESDAGRVARSWRW